MIELSDYEAKQIVAAVQKVHARHMDGSDISGEKLGRLANELEGRMNDLGYEVIVDVTPLLGGDPPVVSIVNKIDRENTIGVEQKMYEVKRRAERKEEVPDIEGHI